MPTIFALLVLWYAPGIIAITLGVVLWTLTEYAIHRLIFHRVPWLRKPHEQHHRRPSGKTGVSSWQSLMLFGLLWLVMPGSVLAGFVLGYICYIVLHHAFHHWTVRTSSWLYSAKMRHTMHHRGVEANFGLTTPLWDHVFHTYAAWPTT